MSLAEETRSAVHHRPYLLTALRAGIVNYAAAARTLGISEDTEAVATALRRYADELPPATTESRQARVSIESNIESLHQSGLVSTTIQDHFTDKESQTAVLVEGDIDAATLEHALALLRTNKITVTAASVTPEHMVIIVNRLDASHVIRLVEEALDAVPIPASDTPNEK